MCSPSVHFQEPPSFLFVTHLYYSDLIWATKLPVQDAPVGFYSTGLSAERILRNSGFSSVVRIRISRRIESIAAAHVVRQPREVFAPIPPHHISGYSNSEYNNFGEYNKRPRIFRYGVFLKNKPAMTYSPTPTKVQYHRREES